MELLIWNGFGRMSFLKSDMFLVYMGVDRFNGRFCFLTVPLCIMECVPLHMMEFEFVESWHQLFVASQHPQLWIEVSVYWNGPYVLKAYSPMVGTLIAHRTCCFWKLGFCQFSILFSFERLLLSDMLCLCNATVREWMLGNNIWLPTCLYTFSAIGKRDGYISFHSIKL